jgi:uncharacterized membrane protein YczE
MPHTATPHALAHRISMLLTGWVLIALSVSTIIRANLGAGPLDVVNTGISKQLHIPVGTAGWVSAAALVLLACILGARPGVATFAGAFIIGVAVNTILPLLPQPASVALRSVMLAAGLVVLCVGCALVMLSDLGSGVVDLLMFALHRRGANLVAARLAIEISATALGFVMGGSVGIATLVIGIGIGPALQRTLRTVSRWLEPLRAHQELRGTLVA